MHVYHNFSCMQNEDWQLMIEQELKELQRLLDRKANHSDLSKYQMMYTYKSTSQPSSPMRTGSGGQLGYRFGQDLTADFKTLFAAFNRVAKQKLDAVILSDFASVKFIDSLYQKNSVQFSAQLKSSSQLYYEQIELRIMKMRNKFNDFNAVVDARLTEIEASIVRLKSIIHKVFYNRRTILERQNSSRNAQHSARDLHSTLHLNNDDQGFLESYSKTFAQTMKMGHKFLLPIPTPSPK